METGKRVSPSNTVEALFEDGRLTEHTLVLCQDLALRKVKDVLKAMKAPGGLRALPGLDSKAVNELELLLGVPVRPIARVPEQRAPKVRQPKHQERMEPVGDIPQAYAHLSQRIRNVLDRYFFPNYVPEDLERLLNPGFDLRKFQGLGTLGVYELAEWCERMRRRAA